MINLYQILQISPFSTDKQIRIALQHYQNQENADPRVIQATAKWLLIHDVRQRYDARLKAEYPHFFQAAYQSEQDDDDYVIIDDTLPSLWHPQVAAFLLFLPMFCTWLHAQNWRELGNEKLFDRNMKLTWVFVGLQVLLAIVIIIFNIGFALSITFDIVMWGSWYATLGQNQIQFVQHHLGEHYHHKRWHKVAFMAIAYLVSAFIVVTILILLAIIAGVVHPDLFPEST